MFEVNTIMEFITNTGFPITCVIVMAFYIRELTNLHKNELKEIEDSHKEEVDTLTSSVTNMCLSIQQLTDRIDELIRKE